MIPAKRDLRYSCVAIILHWTIAALLIFQVALGFRMGGVSGPTKFAAFQLHKSVGITILLLVAIRLAWRVLRTPPPIGGTRGEKALAHAVHAALYALMLALPISGWIIISSSRIAVPTLIYGAIAWPDIPVPAAARAAWHGIGSLLHGRLAWALIALFAVHVAGAMKHHLIDRDGAFTRMAPGVGRGRRADPRLILIALGAVAAAALGLRWSPFGAATAAKQPLPVAESATKSAGQAGTVSKPTLASGPVPAPTAPPVSAPPMPALPMSAPTSEVDASRMTNWRIVRGSTLRFHTTWSGDAIDGGFGAFDGTIAFDENDLPHSKAVIAIDAGSIYSGDAQRDETLKSDDWFAILRFAKATFTATHFRSLGDDRYAADGTLAIKGVSLPSTVRFTLTIKDGRARMRGTANVDRTAYKIGLGDYSATTEIPAVVAVAIVIDAVRIE